jgi:hypothetical protein
MRRREFITLLGGAVVPPAWLFAAGSQRDPIPTHNAGAFGTPKLRYDGDL